MLLTLKKMIGAIVVPRALVLFNHNINNIIVPKALVFFNEGINRTAIINNRLYVMFSMYVLNRPVDSRIMTRRIFRV